MRRPGPVGSGISRAPERAQAVRLSDAGIGDGKLYCTEANADRLDAGSS